MEQLKKTGTVSRLKGLPKYTLSTVGKSNPGLRHAAKKFKTQETLINVTPINSIFKKSALSSMKKNKTKNNGNKEKIL